MNVVIGIGNPYCRDDGVGPALAERLARLGMSDVDVRVSDGEPTAPLEAWTGVGLAIVVDAVLSGPARPGQIHRTNLADLARPPATSSRGMGLPEAVELGRALDRLPDRLIVYAVEAADVGFGTGLSPEVAAALPELLDAVLIDLGRKQGLSALITEDRGRMSVVGRARSVDSDGGTAEGAEMIRVFLVDDHEIVRRGIADFMADEPDLEVVGEASSVSEALTRIPVSDADVAVLDVRLADGNGVELCRELRSRMPQLNCLMLTSYADDEALFDAIMAGASGFVLKRVLGTDLLNAVRTVGTGGSLLDPRTTTALLNRIRRERQQADPLAELTEQEHAVFELIGEGLTNRQIGERLFLAEKTVKNYVSHVLAKLNMERRTQAAALAARLNNPDQRPPEG